MKKLKNLSALLLVIVIISLFVACGNEIIDHATDKLENRIENKVDRIENKVESSISGHGHTHSVKSYNYQNNNTVVADDKITA